uniref:Interferon-induced transmembrane protein 3 n=1 Tax=Leptobrachium leishanense TaxID=445787 RepID=A0A8C5QDA8_9ANUR
MQALPYNGAGYPVQVGDPMLSAPPIYENHGKAPPVMMAHVTNIPVSHTNVVNIEQNVSGVRDFLPWSIFNTLYMNFCCLGFCALVFSVKSRDRKMAGDRSGATNYGSTARKLNIAATTMTVILIFIIIILMISGLITLASSFSNYPYQP